jgi:predicted AlkP superfamily phosphohydrolase/phosphomutase
MDKHQKVLIIGLDGATWTVLTPWIEDGSLPNLAGLRDHGSWGELRSTIPPITAPAWSSFLTGKNPGKHGVFHFIPLDDDPEEHGNGKIEVVDGRSIQSATLWDILGHHNRKVGVINVPMSYPPRPVNGFMITCLLTPPHASIFTYPAELSGQLEGYQIDLDRFIDQKPFARDLQGKHIKREVKPSLQLVQEFYDMEEKRAETALELMTSNPWDVFMVVFTATDRMGHYLWPYHLPGSPADDTETKELRAALHSFYKRLDEHIGRLVDTAGPDTTVIVMSDHGMGSIYTKNTHWNNWLFKKGYIDIERGTTNTPDGWLLRLKLPRDKLRAVMNRIPGLMKNKLVEKARTAPTARIDYQNSRAYYVRIFDPVGGIHVRGEGQAKEALIQELLNEVRQVVDPSTGQPVVRWALRREEYFKGPHASKAPDIILVMHPDFGSSDRLSNYSAIVTDRPSIGDPGGHHIEGILIVSGHGAAAQKDPIPGMVIEDVTPTVLHLLGLPIPTDMDGRALTELLDARLFGEPPLFTEVEPDRWPSEQEAVPILEKPPGDEDVIQDRLRALGYLE